MRAVQLALCIGFFGLLVYAFAVGFGVRPSSVTTEALAPSVRDNPGSYRPAYAKHTGYKPYSSARGGGGYVFVGGGSRSGGHRYGK